jgi:hypothetical protein
MRFKGCYMILKSQTPTPTLTLVQTYHEIYRNGSYRVMESRSLLSLLDSEFTGVAMRT